MNIYIVWLLLLLEKWCSMNLLVSPVNRNVVMSRGGMFGGSRIVVEALTRQSQQATYPTHAFPPSTRPRAYNQRNPYSLAAREGLSETCTRRCISSHKSSVMQVRVSPAQAPFTYIQTMPAPVRVARLLDITSASDSITPNWRSQSRFVVYTMEELQ